MSVRCGNRKVHDEDIARVHHHENAAQVRLCYNVSCGVASIEEEAQAHEDEMAARAEREVEMRYERHLEDAGYWEARADEDYERALGIRDLDMSDVYADAARMEAEQQAQEDARLEREIGPIHWVADEEEAAYEAFYAEREKSLN